MKVIGANGSSPANAQVVIDEDGVTVENTLNSPPTAAAGEYAVRRWTDVEVRGEPRRPSSKGTEIFGSGGALPGQATEIAPIAYPLTHPG